MVKFSKSKISSRDSLAISVIVNRTFGGEMTSSLINKELQSKNPQLVSLYGLFNVLPQGTYVEVEAVKSLKSIIGVLDVIKTVSPEPLEVIEEELDVTDELVEELIESVVEENHQITLDEMIDEVEVEDKEEELIEVIPSEVLVTITDIKRVKTKTVAFLNELEADFGDENSDNLVGLAVLVPQELIESIPFKFNVV